MMRSGACGRQAGTAYVVGGPTRSTFPINSNPSNSPSTPRFVSPWPSMEQGVREANPYLTSLSSFLGFAVFGGQGVLLGPLIVCLATLVYGCLAWFLRQFCGEDYSPDSGGDSSVSRNPDFAQNTTSGAIMGWFSPVATQTMFFFYP